MEAKVAVSSAANSRSRLAYLDHAASVMGNRVALIHGYHKAGPGRYAGGDGFNGRLRWAFNQALARTPQHEEQRVLASLYAREFARFSASPEAADKLLHVGDWPPPRDLQSSEVAAWASVTRVMLNLHESLVRY